MKKFTIVKKNSSRSIQLSKHIKKKLMDNGMIYDEEEPNLVICVGGDGTLLYAVHQFINKLESVKFTAIHTGTLGFFTDYTEDEVEECINDILTKEPKDVFANLLEAKLVGKEVTYYYALNEVRIENVIKTQILDVFIDDKYFETFRGTGMCVSTQSGSTAYNRSLKGAVIDTGLKALQLSEITGIHHSMYRSLGSPLVLKDSRRIQMKSNTFDDATMCFDHLHISLSDVDTIDIALSNKTITFARYRDYSYMNRIRNLY